jgi:hypothetical protein
MKRINLPQLESAREDPIAFAERLNSTTSNSSYGYSKISDWKNAIFEYHKSQDLTATLDYFHDKFYAHFKNTADFEFYSSAIVNYVTDYHDNGLVFVSKRKLMEIVLEPNVLSLRGQVPLVNMNIDGGHSITFFLKTNNEDWQNELKFPIIQNHYASELGIDLSEVEIGIFALDVGSHFLRTYSESEVEDAMLELNSIASTIASNL